MIIIPAIDIQGGAVVRLTQGKLNKKVYSKDPVKTAKYWASQGAELIHIVDLDGATSGACKNVTVLKNMLTAIKTPVEFGGGVRELSEIKTLINSGVSRVILGTRAAEDQVFLKKAFKQFKDKIIVSVDTRFGSVMVKGWQKGASKPLDMMEFIRSLKDIGFKEVIYTDTLKDGMLKGPNIQELKRILKETGIGVIASGGISSLNDIRKLKSLEKSGLTGVIVGKALYEGKFTLPQALKLS